MVLNVLPHYTTGDASGHEHNFFVHRPVPARILMSPFRERMSANRLVNGHAQFLNVDHSRLFLSNGADGWALGAWPEPQRPRAVRIVLAFNFDHHVVT